MKKFGFLLLLLLLTGCENMDTVRTYLAERGVREKIGILAHLDIAWPDSTKAFVRALSYFREAQVDKIVILGDPTKNGYENQRQVFELAWHKAFAGEMPPERVMSEDPYVYEGINFTGKGLFRYSLTDLLCVHPRNGRTVNAGSMHGIAVSDVFDKQENAVIARMGASAQGLLVLAREEGLEIRRLDFSGAIPEEVGPPWRVDRAGMIDSEEDQVPRFWEDTRVDVTPGYDAKGQRVYTVRWPPVLAKHTGARAFSYDVSVGNRVVRRVQSSGFFLPESRDTDAVKCCLLADEFGEEIPRFGITPISSMGKLGPTIWSR